MGDLGLTCLDATSSDNERVSPLGVPLGTGVNCRARPPSASGMGGSAEAPRWGEVSLWGIRVRGLRSQGKERGGARRGSEVQR